MTSALMEQRYSSQNQVFRQPARRLPPLSGALRGEQNSGTIRLKVQSHGLRPASVGHWRFHPARDHAEIPSHQARRLPGYLRKLRKRAPAGDIVASVKESSLADRAGDLASLCPAGAVVYRISATKRLEESSISRGGGVFWSRQRKDEPISWLRNTEKHDRHAL